MRALALGADVTEVVEAVTTVTDTLTLALYGASKLTHSNIAPHASGTEIVVGTLGTLETGLVASDNALTWTERVPGSAPSVVLVDPAGNNGALAVGVVGKVITVTLATDGSSDPTSTAAQVIAEILDTPAAAALVSVAHTGASDGTGVVAAVSQTALAGGVALAATKYEVDTVGGYIKPLHVDAVGAKAISYTTAAGTFESYAAGAATSRFAHVTGMVRDNASGAFGEIDFWRVNLAAKGEFDPTTGEFVNVELEGSIGTPKDGDGAWITIAGRVPTSPWRFQRKTA